MATILQMVFVNMRFRKWKLQNRWFANKIPLNKFLRIQLKNVNIGSDKVS